MHVGKLSIQLIDQFNKSQSGLRISLERNDAQKQILFIILNGQLSEMNSAAFVDVLFEVIGQLPETRSLIFDLSPLTYISSSGIGAFVNILMRTEDLGISIVLCGPGKNIQSVFSVLGFTQFFRMVNSRAEAVSAAAATKRPVTRIAGRHSCPKCHGKLEELDDNTYRCLNCGTQFRRRKDGFFGISIDGGDGEQASR